MAALIRTCVLLVVLALSGTQGALAADPATEAGPLVPAGRWIKDQTGRTVILQGVFGVWKPIGPPADPGDVVHLQAYADHLAALGMNAYRLAYQWAGLEPQRGTFDASYLERVAHVEGDLARAGVFTLIDSHQDLFAERYGPATDGKAQGNGFPDWAAQDDGLPAPSGPLNLGSPANYFQPSTSRAFDHFWANEGGVLDEYARQWQVVARRFANDPHVLGYDLINEPWPGSQWPSCLNPGGCPAFDTASLQPAQDRWATAIRAVDGSHMVFYEPHFFFDGGVASWLSAPPASAGPAALSFHDICAARALRQGASQVKDLATQAEHEACPVTHEQGLNNGVSTAGRMGVPPLMTEFMPADEKDRDGLECMLERAERHRMGWTFGRYPADNGPNDKNDDILARVFPRAVAGEPVDYGFDPRTGVFHLRYRPDPSVTVPTLIAVPTAVHYPHGYVADVSGGHADSKANADRLTVAADPGAAEVEVTVRPPAGDDTARPALPDCAHPADGSPDLSLPPAGLSG